MLVFVGVNAMIMQGPSHKDVLIYEDSGLQIFIYIYICGNGLFSDISRITWRVGRLPIVTCLFINGHLP